MCPYILSPLREFRPRNSYIDLKINLDSFLEFLLLLPKLLPLVHGSFIRLSPTGFAYSSILSLYDLEVLSIFLHKSVPCQSQYFPVAEYETDSDDISWVSILEKYCEFEINLMTIPTYKSHSLHVEGSCMVQQISVAILSFTFQQTCSERSDLKKNFVSNRKF